MWNKVFNSDHDKRLSGYDDWHIVNEIHIQKFQINFHCTFALSKKYGIVVCAVRGTEFNTSNLIKLIQKMTENLKHSKDGQLIFTPH
jgi:phospholipid N-methyltransferase